jgi:ABC-2 type transport system permease protein
VTQDANAVAKSGTARSHIDATATTYLSQLWGVAEAEVEKLIHDPFEVFTRAIQPLLWLLLFGQVMARAPSTPARSAMRAFSRQASLRKASCSRQSFTESPRSGSAISAYCNACSSAPRRALVIGKATSSAVRGWIQAFIVYLVVLIMGADVSLDPRNILGALLFIGLGSGFFSTFSLIIACPVRTRERFKGIGQVLTMPIFFASNAIYPIDVMPRWLQWVSHFNPLTYQVDAMRALILQQGTTTIGLGIDFAVLTIGCIILTAIAARLYPRIGT